MTDKERTMQAGEHKAGTTRFRRQQRIDFWKVNVSLSQKHPTTATSPQSVSDER